MTQQPQSGRSAWMARAQWDARVRGDECFFCTELNERVESNELFIRIADLQVSQLRLATDQTVRGYCVLIATTHVTEPFELGVSGSRAYFEDLMLAARVLTKVFEPDKMNYQILGNLVPHLHCHLHPRYYGDLWPGAPAGSEIEPVLLSPEEYLDRVTLIRRALIEAADRSLYRG